MTVPTRRCGSPVACAAIAAMLLVVGLGCSSQGEPAGSLPDGFRDQLVARVPTPTDLDFAPDGRLFVTSQPGTLYAVRAGRQAVVLDLVSQVCAQRERGLLGVTFDPRFRENRFAYVYYTFKKFGGCPARSDRAPVNRVVRYRTRRDGTLDTRTARILIDNVPSFHGIHNAGDLAFGRDGYLYVSIGDGGRDYARRTSKSFTNAATRDRNVLLGKVVRITRDGLPAAGNPYTGPATARCATTGPVEPGLECREIYAWGLRNPFRLAFDPNAEQTRFRINDVGEVTWEEVNEGRVGANYGWNLREGNCERHGRVRCPPGPPSTVDPVIAYAHRHGCGSITGGAFVPDGRWPASYDGAYLFADFLCGTIFIANRPDGKDLRTFVSGLPPPSVTSMTFAQQGERALYYTTFARGGEVRRIVYAPERSS
jgi:glucose/arabinose dehydrogenase